MAYAEFLLRPTYCNHLNNESHRLAKCLPNHKGLRVKFEHRAEEIYKRCPDPYDIEKTAPYVLELMKLYQRMVAWHEHKEAQIKMRSHERATYGRISRSARCADQRRKGL